VKNYSENNERTYLTFHLRALTEDQLIDPAIALLQLLGRLVDEGWTFHLLNWVY
jgi:hypothetical protein